MKVSKHFLLTPLLILNIILLLVFVFASLAIPRIAPGGHWYLGILGLVFPLILALVIAFIVFWFMVHFKYSLFGIIALIVCWKFVLVFFALHPFSGKAKDSNPDRITIMSYNVHYFKNLDKSKKDNASLRDEMMALIKEQKPDILCLQEFYTSENPHNFDNKNYISEEMRLPYRYFSSDRNYANNHSGVIIFSRYPIVNSAKVELLENEEKGEAIYVDIKKGTAIFRVFTTHLQSIYLDAEDRKYMGEVKRQENPELSGSKRIFKKLKVAFTKRATQAGVLSEKIKESPYPVLVCGDFNDTPNSYTYFKVKGSLKDAFLEKGFGIGRTYSQISPTLRIDYILTDPGFQTEGFYVIHRTLSDHFPVIAQLEYTNRH